MVMRRVPDNPGSTREPWAQPTARIDWLAGPIADRDGSGRSVVDAWLDTDRSSCTPDAGFARSGYNTWLGDQHGTKIAFERRERLVLTPDGEREQRNEISKSYLILKGTGLTALRARGIDDQNIVEQFQEWSGQCRRIDLAVDVQHPEVTPRALATLHAKRHFATKLRETWFGGKPNQGETFYLKGKHQVFRCYDKTAERARKGVTIEKGITRLELELHDTWAQRAFDALCQIDTQHWIEEFPRLVIGTILGKARPLAGPRPPHHVNRAPIWEPLKEALRGIGPVRLPKHELDRKAEQQLANRIIHAQNFRGTYKLLRALVPKDRLEAFFENEALTPEDLELIERLRNGDPEHLKAILVGCNLLPTDEPHTN